MQIPLKLHRCTYRISRRLSHHSDFSKDLTRCAPLLCRVTVDIFLISPSWVLQPRGQALSVTVTLEVNITKTVRMWKLFELMCIKGSTMTFKPRVSLCGCCCLYDLCSLFSRFKHLAYREYNFDTKAQISLNILNISIFCISEISQIVCWAWTKGSWIKWQLYTK